MSLKLMNKYYVYIHRRLSDDKPFYVGKGSGNRAWDVKGKSRNDYWHRVANKHGFYVDLVFENLTEEEAFDCEVNTILELKYFGYPLTNLSSGGEGNSGLDFTDEQRLNIANGLKEKRYSNKIKVTKVIQRPTAYGDNNHFADNTEYEFVRLQDGYTIKCTRHKLAELFGVDKQLIKKLFYKTNPRKSADGWRLKDKT